MVDQGNNRLLRMGEYDPVENRAFGYVQGLIEDEWGLYVAN
jgi:hypothetical protein